MSILVIVSNVKNKQNVSLTPVDHINESYGHQILFSQNEKVIYYPYIYNGTKFYNEAIVAMAYRNVNTDTISYSTITFPLDFHVIPTTIVVKNMSQPITFKIISYNSNFNLSLPYDTKYIVINSVNEEISSNYVVISVTLYLRNVTENSTLLLPIVYNGNINFITIYIE